MTTGHRLALAATLLAYSLLTAASAALATVIPLPMEEVVRRSHGVVRADVLETSSAWGEWINGGRVIYTTARVRVTDVLVGRSDTEVEVTVLGGVVDGERMIASDCPTLESGEDVVLFLLDYEGRTWIAGLSNGKYRVVGGEAINEGHQTGRRIPLDTLQREIREAQRIVDSSR